jgi:anti-anti-sigma factor
MEFLVETTENGVDIVRFKGRLDMAGVQEIDAKFSDLVKNQGRPLLVDLTELAFLASVGIRLLLTSAKALASKKLKMALCNAQPMVADTLKDSVIDVYIPVCADRPSAMEALAGKAPAQ